MLDLIGILISLANVVLQLIFFIILLVFLFLLLSKFSRMLLKLFYKKHLPRPAITGHILNSRIRKTMQPPKSITNALDIEKGMNILEIGAGGGTYTLDAARRTQTGTVFATDVSEGMLNSLKKNVLKSNLNNIKIEFADVYALPYQDNMFDRVFMVTVTGELDDKIRAFKEIHRVLKTKGKMTVGEFFIDPDYPLQRSVKKWAAQTGFIFLRSRQRIIHYTMTFEKGER